MYVDEEMKTMIAPTIITTSDDDGTGRRMFRGLFPILKPLIRLLLLLLLAYISWGPCVAASGFAME
jgi:hypothetical protein